MKKAIILPFLFASLFAFSQGSKVAFTLSNGKPETRDNRTGLKLPLTISFTKDFKGKELILTDKTKSQNFNGRQVLGEGDLLYHGTDPFEYRIENDGNRNKTNPGDRNVPSDEILLNIAGEDFLLKLEITPSDVINGLTQGIQTKVEVYESGYIYYDAMKLSDTNSSIAVKMQILKSYGINDSLTIDKNPYLNDILGYLYTKNMVQGAPLVPLMTKLGNTDVTYFAAGLARFLAERTKDELNEAFFNKMNEQLNAYPELKTIFPKTASFLNVIETYSYASVIQILKESFETDIHNLPENLYNVKSLTSADCNSVILGEQDSDNCKKRLDKLQVFFKSEEGLWIGLGMFTVKEAMMSSNPADLLKSITESAELTEIKAFSRDSSKNINYNIASSIELGNFISQSLISKDNNQIWITLKEFSELFKDKDQKAFKIYLGLLLAKELKGDVLIDFYKTNDSTITFGSILKGSYIQYKKYEPDIISLIKNSYTAFNSANNAVKKMISATDKSAEADPQALYDYYRTFTSSLKPIAHNTLLSSITGCTGIGAEYDQIEAYLNPAVDIAYHITTKKYSAAVYNVVILLNNSKNPVFNKPVAKSFIKYGTLIAGVANAQSSDEVKRALEASVLPVGSYSIKRKTNWSFSINSYVGAYWNYSNSKDYIPSLGLSAPIGFNISKGFPKAKKAGSLGLNIQIIDLGALVNYYLIKGDTAALPNDFNVRLSNIFAPGFNFCYNVPRTPLSLAWGGQYIPALYEVDQIAGKNEFTPVSAWRWQLSILIDIPLINIKVWDYNK
jgi:hypothetical protein